MITTELDITFQGNTLVVNAGIWTRYYYDLAGRLAGIVATTRYSRSSSGAVLEEGTWTNVYNGLGLIGTRIHPRGLTETTTYSSRRLPTRVARVDDYDPGVESKTDYAYNVYGDVTTVVHPRNSDDLSDESDRDQDDYLYDGYTRIKQHIRPGGRVTTDEPTILGLPEVIRSEFGGEVVRETSYGHDGCSSDATCGCSGGIMV
ncbi:MAG: hypothetical protein GY722_03395 [bacterium]|nr:hypothetical protein [bacterium]